MFSSFAICNSDMINVSLNYKIFSFLTYDKHLLELLEYTQHIAFYQELYKKVLETNLFNRLLESGVVENHIVTIAVNE